ncbi:helix-turn-helix domain-containing protein [Antrihabitans cavernicola]|uniref:Helix-turn-helix domain-containing protein n=1 Tax=Antrihabitans cavernicola TaxID=2495913 RepID=A0A5A7S4I1_9NOCA|nr:helix-turn-helix domain-containing protein [Spelaeibacter cavernicola]KAA0016556.1 helix-turn-helix domain-containing protein [Spelaeibacter cavernicola]
MTAQALEQQTFLPEKSDELAQVVSFLAIHEAKHGNTIEPRYVLVGADEHDQVVVPASVHRILKQVVDAMEAGRAVTVAPQSTTLTTQQAADLLGVSRPTVKRLIDIGDLPAERVGTRHKLLLTDVLDYRKKRRTRQYEALAETSIDLLDENVMSHVMADTFSWCHR